MYYFDMERSQTSQTLQPLIRQFTAIHGPLYYLFKNFFHLLYSLLNILFEYFVHFCVSSSSLAASCRLHLFQFLRGGVWGGGSAVVSACGLICCSEVFTASERDTKLWHKVNWILPFLIQLYLSEMKLWSVMWSVKRDELLQRGHNNYNLSASSSRSQGLFVDMQPRCLQFRMSFISMVWIFPWLTEHSWLVRAKHKVPQRCMWRNEMKCGFWFLFYKPGGRVCQGQLSVINVCTLVWQELKLGVTSCCEAPRGH